MLCVVLSTLMVAGSLQSPESFGDHPRHRSNPDQVGGYSSELLLIQFRDRGVGEEFLKTPHKRSEFRVLVQQQSIEWVRPGYDVAEGFAHPALAEALGLDRYYLVKVAKGVVNPLFVQQVQMRDDLVERAELVNIGSVALRPNDPFLGSQYYLSANQLNYVYEGSWDADINILSAWDIIHSAPVKVGVIDAGVMHHVELVGRVLPGWNTVQNNSTNVTDFDCPHGTHVAGIVAASGNDGKGISGINWGALIIPVKVVTGCWGYDVDAGEGVIWATDRGADIVSMSLQYTNMSQYFRLAIEYAYRRNRLPIAAAGNWYEDYLAYPARYPFCMAVGAIDNQNRHASFSNQGFPGSTTGEALDVAAYGVYVNSTVGDTGYLLGSGTSMATPIVSAVASLVKGLRPDLHAADIEYFLRASAVDLGPRGEDAHYGHGRIDARRALEMAEAYCLADFNYDGQIDSLDVEAFQTAYASSHPRADFDRDTSVTNLDLVAFMIALNEGC